LREEDLTSAGDRAVTDATGGFELAVDLPPDAESVQVTAVYAHGQGRSLVASGRKLRHRNGGVLAAAVDLALRCHCAGNPSVAGRLQSCSILKKIRCPGRSLGRRALLGSRRKRHSRCGDVVTAQQSGYQGEGV